MPFAQLVMGPAGSGKSTYCHNLVLHAKDNRRTITVINLDPACDNYQYESLADIRDLIQVEDAMEDEELNFGPNGGLIFCMEFLLSKSEWLKEQLEGIGEDDYILFDCPGQIELYTHMNVMNQFIDLLQSWDFRVCGVFLLDSHFALEMSKFFSATLTTLSTMIKLEIPQINVLSKMDLLSKKSKDQIERFLDVDTDLLLEDNMASNWDKRFVKLNSAICGFINSYSMVRFMPLDITNEENIHELLSYIDNSFQYGEELDVRVTDFEEATDEGYDD